MSLSSFFKCTLAALWRYVCTATLLAACSVALLSPANAQQALVLAVSKSAVNLPIFVAEHEGYFTAEGVSVKIEEVASGVRGMELLAEGKADLTTGSETLVMFKLR